MSTDFTAVFHEFDAAIDANNVSAIIDISKRHLDASFRSALFDRVNRIVEEWAAGDVDRDRKETRRLMNYLYAVGVGADHVTISFLQELFNQREKFILLRSNNNKVGDNVVRCVAAQLVNVGDANDLRMVGKTHECPGVFEVAFVAAAWSMSPEEVFSEFSPYIKPYYVSQTEAPGDHVAGGKYDFICKQVELLARGFLSLSRLSDDGYLGQNPLYWSDKFGIRPQLDPRWLDAAIEADFLNLARINLIDSLRRKDYPPLNEYLVNKIDRLLSENRDAHFVLEVMVKIGHPQAAVCCLKSADHFIRPQKTVEDEKGNSKGSYYYDAYAMRMAQLPEHAAEFDQWAETLPQKEKRKFRKELKDARAAAAE